MKKDKVSSDVPVEMAAARVGPKAQVLKRKSKAARHLLHPWRLLLLLKRKGMRALRALVVAVAGAGAVAAVAAVLVAAGATGAAGAFPAASAA